MEEGLIVMNRRIKLNRKVLVLLAFVTACVLCSCGNNKNKSNTSKNTINQAAVKEIEKNYDGMFTGVVKKYDEDKKTVTVYNINEKKEYVFNYNGGTDIKDEYDTLITMPQIEMGEIVDVYYYESNQKLTALNISKEAWTYKHVGNLKTDKTSQRMKISNHNYWYDEGLLLFSQTEPIELLDLHAKDELTVKGVGSQICSIIVTTGHGYIRLTNYNDFIGGTIEVGYGIITPIVKDMLIVAKEGKYKVILENGELIANKNINLKRNEEITLDMSGYKMPKERIGYVRFDIEPFGADLFINGTSVNYLDPIKLNYGRHRIRVTMNGYDDFNGFLTIGETTPTITIRLAEGSYDVESEDTQTGETQTSHDSTIEEVEDKDKEPDISGDEETLGTTSVDKNHTITVESPAGASLYLNGKLMGTVPITFTKEIGTHIMVFSQNGYVTKSYSVEVLDDNENAVFNFPDMLALTQ